MSSRFPYPRAAALSLVLGLASLALLPRALAYDPWSWLTWGRELDHLSLTTRGSATSFKPLTVFVAAILAPSGRLAPWLWLAIARAGLVMTVLLAFHLGRRIQGPVAGLLAAAGAITIYRLLSYLTLMGMSEPLVAMCCLAAVDCSLSRSHRAAFVWLAVASLLELELALVMVCYGLAFVVWPSQRRLRAGVALLAFLLVIAVCWMLPDLLSTGNALRSVKIARNATLGGPELQRFPFWATLDGARRMTLWPVWVGWLGEIVLGTALAVRRRILRPLFAPALVAALFVVGCAVLTQMHMMTGNTRFLVGAAVVGVVAAACLWVEAATTAGTLLARHASHLRAGPSSHPWRGTAWAALAVLVVALVLATKGGLIHWRDEVRAALTSGRATQALQADLPQALAGVGGRAAVLSCKPIETTSLMVSFVAWELRVASRQVGDRPGSDGTVITARPTGSHSKAMRVVWSRAFDPGRRSDAVLYVLSSCRRTDLAQSLNASAASPVAP